MEEDSDSDAFHTTVDDKTINSLTITIVAVSIVSVALVGAVIYLVYVTMNRMRMGSPFRHQRMHEVCTWKIRQEGSRN